MGQATAIEADPFPRATTPEARAYWRMIDQAAERVRALDERLEAPRD